MAWQGKAVSDTVWLGQARLGLAWQERTWQG